MAIGADRLADAFERAPTLLARLAGVVSPQDAPETVIAKAREVIAVITERERVGILNAHPRIGADARTLSALSREEQGTSSDEQTARELAELNEAYERKFGFRFVVFVNGRNRRDIVPVLRLRLKSSRDRELATGLDEFLAISLDRLRKTPA